ncbi:MAG: MiaB/RimO family radical SAM methylthiotransferase, partial [Vicinamibacterales bacterium]|nr:MiaB/RimO family radical SAM methylthiotransferase [Vicinamibacterales bacterium]
MKYAIVTFGCRVNQADSFEFDEGLRARGAVESAVEDADLVIVNTCTVTGAADQGARQTIRRIARDNGQVRIVVTGCYATRTPDQLAGLPRVIRLVSNDGKRGLVECLDDEFPLTTAARFGAGHGGCDATEPGAMGRTAYPLRVQTGCDEQCAYCIIPSTRGVSTSRPLDEVLAEASRLAASGYKELWLVGVHLGSYGRDLAPSSSLLDLARALDRLPGDVTCRISSLEPMDCPGELVDLVARSGRFAPHFHLPLQHTSDRVLRAMRRPYTFASFERLVAGIRLRIPHAFIGTDFIAGFPGETDDDIAHAIAGLPTLPLAALHVFPYSDRPGTAAAAMDANVPSSVVTDRARRLRDVGRVLGDHFARSMLGTTRPGLTLDDGT